MEERKLKEAVDKTFEAMFALEDVRQIWRDTVPDHKLSADQQAELRKLLELVKDNADFILQSMEVA